MQVLLGDAVYEGLGEAKGYRGVSCCFSPTKMIKHVTDFFYSLTSGVRPMHALVTYQIETSDSPDEF